MDVLKQYCLMKFHGFLKAMNGHCQIKIDTVSITVIFCLRSKL